MSVRLLLQYTACASQALVAAVPWTRLLIETESPCGTGHCVGEIVKLRKSINSAGIIDHIVIEQDSTCDALVQRYLAVSQWWLLKLPFAPPRLTLSLVAHNYPHSLLKLPLCTVTHLDLSCPSSCRAPSCIDLEAIRTLLPQLEVLNVSGVWRYGDVLRVVRNVHLLRQCTRLRELSCAHCDLSDLSVIPLKSLELLDIAGCQKIEDVRLLSTAQRLRSCTVRHIACVQLSVLSGCRYLEEVDITGCRGVTDLSPAVQWLGLRVLSLCFTYVSDLSALSGTQLRVLMLIDCPAVTEVAALAGAAFLEKLVAFHSGLTSVAGLALCPRLTELDVSSCYFLTDLSPLAGAPSLTSILADLTPVSNITGLQLCPRLRTLTLSRCCNLHDIRCLSGAPALQSLDVTDSPVVGVDELRRSCPMLRCVRVEAAVTPPPPPRRRHRRHEKKCSAF